MDTTVIIPNYNGADYIEACLKSLYDSGEEELKIIVVDDGSSDRSPDIVRTRFPDVKLIMHGSNRGFAAAVNTGITSADTEYVLLLNNDTVVTDHFVSSMQEAIGSDGKIFSASAKMLKMSDPDIADGAGDYYCALGWAYAYGKDRKASGLDKTRQVFSACGGAAIYRRKVFDIIGLFDERHFAYLEDTDVGYRAKIYGYRNIYAPDAVVLHAGSGTTGSRYNEFKIRLSSRNSTYLICKNMPVLQQVINLPFFIIGFAVKLLFFATKGYGGLYIKGLFAGIRMGYDVSGRDKRVRFKMHNLGNYFVIQLQLWINVIRRFV